MAKVNTKGKSFGISEIKSGNYNTDSSWSFSAEDGNALLGKNGDDWENYGKHHLGIDTSAEKETKAYYKYPFAKSDGVYRKGLTAVRQRAGQQGEDDIFKAAGDLIDAIDKKEGKTSSPVKPEYRFIPFEDKELRFDAADSGSLEGYANVKGMIDAYGSIMIDGCYKQLDSMRANGVVPDTHFAQSDFISTVQGSYGYFTEIKEDERGLFVRANFHSDPEAQVIRVRTMERRAAGATMGLSIGFTTLRSFRIYPKDYRTELPKYSKPEFLAWNLNICNAFPYIEIKQEIAPKETSVTVMPANEASLVTDVRAKMKNIPTEFRAQYLGEYVEGTIGWYGMQALTNALCCMAYEECTNEAPLEESLAEIDGACLETAQYMKDIVTMVKTWRGSEESKQEMLSGLRSLFIQPELLNATNGVGVNYKRHVEMLSEAIKEFGERTKKRTEILDPEIRAGKKVATEKWNSLKSMHEDMNSAYDTLGGCIEQMSEFLDSTDPNAEQLSKGTESLRLARLSLIRSTLSQKTV